MNCRTRASIPRATLPAALPNRTCADMNQRKAAAQPPETNSGACCMFGAAGVSRWLAVDHALRCKASWSKSACFLLNNSDSGRRPWRALHKQASDCPRQLLSLIRAAASLLRRNKTVTRVSLIFIKVRSCPVPMLYSGKAWRVRCFAAARA